MDGITLIISGLIDKGGIWGIVAAAIFFWNLHKESTTEKKDSQSKKEITTNKERHAAKEKELSVKIAELEESIKNLGAENKKLLAALAEVEKDRVDDLKALLTEYHSTAFATLQALEKFEFFITNSKRS
jgi:molecular chaperone GrpE (heat shock protein)